MTAPVVTIPSNGSFGTGISTGQRMRVIVHVDREVLTAEEAVHQARTWLAGNISEFLTVTTPELVIDDDLFWRFEVMLGIPNEVQPGSGALYGVGQMRLHAETGAVVNADALAAELRVHVDSLAP